MTGLSFAELRTQNVTRSGRWHPDGIDDWSVADWAVAMLGEAGEAAHAIKKLRRIETGAANLSDPGRSLTDRAAAIAAIGEELADTMIYLDLLALRLGIDLTQAVIGKFNKTSERYGFPERLYDGAADTIGSWTDGVAMLRVRTVPLSQDPDSAA